jgi:hypothetical protein
MAGFVSCATEERDESSKKFKKPVITYFIA